MVEAELGGECSAKSRLSEVSSLSLLSPLYRVLLNVQVRSQTQHSLIRTGANLVTCRLLVVKSAEPIRLSQVSRIPELAHNNRSLSISCLPLYNPSSFCTLQLTQCSLHPVASQSRHPSWGRLLSHANANPLLCSQYQPSVRQSPPPRLWRHQRRRLRRRLVSPPPPLATKHATNGPAPDSLSPRRADAGTPTKTRTTGTSPPRASSSRALPRGRT